MAPVVAATASAGSLKDLIGHLNRNRYVSLLTDLMAESKYVQNSPPDYQPQENLVARHVMDALLPLSTKSGGGPLVVEQISYIENRSNIIVEYPGTASGHAVSFVGMHMDVVPANPEEWHVDPFKLTVDAQNPDKLWGRGTTDCLGHVALVTELMRRLAEAKPALKNSVFAVYICNEEDGTVQNIGVEQLAKTGKLDRLKNGPLYWIDVADKQPCIASGGIITWHLTANGKLFHSGFPQKAINAMELNMEALKVIQTWFYKDVPPHPCEKEYKYESPSSMKPTQWSYPGGGINQIAGQCTISGDVRLTAFYQPETVVEKLNKYVNDINEHVERLDVRGPVSKYVLPDEGIRGSLELKIDDDMGAGIACKLDSRGYEALVNATKEVVGKVEPYADTGYLPLVSDLQKANFDVQLTGYGVNDVYHGNNEYCMFSDMSQGFDVFLSIITQLEADI